MTSQIFPEPFYNQLLCHGERVGVNSEGNFKILPRESFCHRLKRFFTFQQDSDFDLVHERIKSLVEQMSDKKGVDFSKLKDEIHAHGGAKYKYLEANLISLRDKMDKIGYLNPLSKKVLKIINAVRHLFKKPAIQLKGYSWFTLGVYNRSFNFDGKNFGEEGLKLTEDDKKSCTFSATYGSTEEIIQKLEKGLIDYFTVHTFSENYELPEGEKRITTCLEMAFDPKKKQFFLQINTLRSLSNPFTVFSKNSASYLQNLGDEMYFYVKTKITDEDEYNHKMNYKFISSEKSPYEINVQSVSFPLKLNTEYSFCTQDNRESMFSFTITHKE